MVSKEQLKAIEQAAFIGEKKRLEAEKTKKKADNQSAKDRKAAEEAAKRGIAKARGKPYVGEGTRKAGGFLLRVGKKVAQNIAESDTGSGKQRTKKTINKTITVEGEKYTLFKHTQSKNVADKAKKQAKASGKKVRQRTSNGTYLIYVR